MEKKQKNHKLHKGEKSVAALIHSARTGTRGLKFS